MDPHYTHSTCFECCHGDLCNNKGCGRQGKLIIFIILYASCFQEVDINAAAADYDDDIISFKDILHIVVQLVLIVRKFKTQCFVTKLKSVRKTRLVL